MTAYRTRTWTVHCPRCQRSSPRYRLRLRTRWWAMTHDCTEPERLYDGHIPPE